MRIAILGGGAVTRIFYAPIFRSAMEGMSLTAIVDPSQDALGKLGVLPQGTELVCAPFEQYLQNLSNDRIEAVIVALPHHLHEPSVMAALNHGLHVFCEKPLGLSAESVQRMQVASTDTGRVLAVCQPRRSFKVASAIRELLRSGWMGPVSSISWKEGQPYAWPAESLAQVLEEQGGGELVDIGAHVFDMLVWWLGELEVVEYTDDSAGGVAAEYRIRLASALGISVDVELSRLFHLENAAEIVCQRGRIRWDLKSFSDFELELTFEDNTLRAGMHPDLGHNAATSMKEAIRLQLLEFRDSINTSSVAKDSLMQALGYAQILEQCWKRQKRRSRLPAKPDAERAVVTGASGFIGTRLVEMLDDRGASILALARRAQSCVRLARRPVEIRLADVRDSSQLDQAMAGGGDVVYHCAVASGSSQIVRDTIIDGTLNVLRCAERHGFRRVVVFSSMLALGNPAAHGSVDDDSPPHESELPYAQAKKEMERQCRLYAASSRVEVVILRPTCVFGPFGRDFGSAQLDRQAKDEFFLLESGRGLANLVYVDNLAEAAILAADAKCQSGSCFIVNEEEWPMTWAEFLVPQIKRAFGVEMPIPDLSVARLTVLETEHRQARSFPTVIRKAIRSHAASAEWVSNHPMFRVWKKIGGWVRRPEDRSQHSQHSQTTARQLAAGSIEHKTRGLEENISQFRSFPYGPFYRSFFTTQSVFRSDGARNVFSWRPNVDRRKAMRETLTWIERAYADGKPKS